MRLLEVDLPGPAARQALSRELVYRTSGTVDAGLNSRKAAVAELARAVAETRDGIRAAGGGKHRADRLVRHAADAFEDLTGEAVPVSGTGEGRYPRLVAAVLERAGSARCVGAGRRAPGGQAPARCCAAQWRECSRSRESLHRTACEI